jgi:general secretion pathway protein D
VPVDISRARMPASALLRWVGRFGGLEYSLRDGAVVLAIRGGALDEPERRTYDISSLVTPPNEAQPLPELGPVEPLSVVSQRPGGREEEVNPDVIGQGWVDYLRNTVAAETWGQVLQEAGPQYTIAYRNGRIVVVHTPDVHRQIEEILNNFRRARNLQVHMLARFIELSSAYLDSFTFDITSYTSSGTLGDPAAHNWAALAQVRNYNERAALTRFPNFFGQSGGLTIEYNYLGDDDVGLLLEAVLKKRRGTILTAPRLTCFNTQRANLQVLTNYNYVRRVTTDDEPEIGNVPEGIIFDIQPFVSADRRYITLVFQPQMRELVELADFHYSTEVQVIDQGDVAIGILQDSFVQLPTTRLRSMGTTVTVPNGGTLLAGGFTEVEERHALAGVPFVEKLPLIGRILRSWAHAEGRRSLIVLVRAETVPDIFEE